MENISFTEAGELSDMQMNIYALRIRLLSEETEPFWNIDTAFGVVAGKDLVPKFLYFFCLSYNFKKLDKSTGRPSVSKSDLLKIEMPIPTINEQQRIVSRIEELFSELDKGVETLQTIKQQLETYRQGC